MEHFLQMCNMPEWMQNGCCRLAALRTVALCCASARLNVLHNTMKIAKGVGNDQVRERCLGSPLCRVGVAHDLMQIHALPCSRLTFYIMCSNSISHAADMDRAAHADVQVRGADLLLRAGSFHGRLPAGCRGQGQALLHAQCPHHDPSASGWRLWTGCGH